MDIPKGAIRSEAEIRELRVMWKASRRHSTDRKPWKMFVTGETGVVRRKHYEYHFYRVKLDEEDQRTYDASLVDINIPELNGYNDWFLFANLADAEAYLKD